MNRLDTSREAVERLAETCSADVADVLRALLIERDAAQAALRAARLEALAANDAPILDLEAAYRAGAEAMRKKAADEIDCGCRARVDVLARLASDGEKVAARACIHDDSCLALQAAAIRALPLPGMTVGDE